MCHVNFKKTCNQLYIDSFLSKRKKKTINWFLPIQKKKNLLFKQLCVACGISFGPYIFAFTFKINENNVKRYPY